jgi:hypothetical protein
MTIRSLPWTYPYQREVRADNSFIEYELLGPVVTIRLSGERLSAHNVAALVDSGSDHILAAPWIAQDIGVTPDPMREMQLQVGGHTRTVRFADVTISLLPPEVEIHQGGYEPSEVRSFEGQVGFFLEWASPPWMVVLGQRGCFDRLTITMSRYSQALAVTGFSDFDERFPQSPMNSSPFSPRQF